MTNINLYEFKILDNVLIRLTDKCPPHSVIPFYNLFGTTKVSIKKKVIYVRDMAKTAIIKFKSIYNSFL